MAEAEAFYGGAYFHGGDYLDYLADEVVLKRNFQRFAGRVRQVAPSGRLLEVGCAFGFFLDVARERWDVEGVDISAEAVDACRARYGNRVHQGDLMHVPLPEGTYDCIVAWDVVEHVNRPRDYLTRMNELLKPGGYLAVTTGDIGSLAARLAGARWRLLTPPSHLSFFTRAGMERALRDSGFSEHRIETTGYYRSLKFAMFRLTGWAGLENWLQVHSFLGTVVDSLHFYLNLGDIMFVLARKPIQGNRRERH